MAGYAAFAYTYPTQPSTSKRQHKQTSTVVTFTQRNLAVTQHEIEDTLIPHVFLEIHPHKKGRPSIYVLNAYSSPKDSSKQAAALIHKTAILAGTAPLLIAGDFNARHQAWGYPRSLPKGVAIWNTLQTDHLTLITDPDYPTREGNSVSPDTTPDLFITRNIPLATWSNTRNTLGSDHFILEITIPDNTHKRRETAEKRLVNWDHFRALREEEGEAVDLGSWTRALQDSVRQATDTVPAASPEGRADAKLLHMWQALERLRARWSKQKRNRSLRKRISRLERDIETYAIELDSQHWGQICDQINGKLGLRDTWGLLRHLMDPQGSKTVQRNTLTKVASTFPGDARALIEALKDKNMNPTFHIQRRKARAEALHKLYAGRPDVYFVDAANYSEHRDRYALAVVDGTGRIVVMASVKEDSPTRAEEAAIGLALNHASESLRTIICDSKTAILGFSSGMSWPEEGPASAMADERSTRFEENVAFGWPGSQILWRCIKVASFFLLLCVFLYQASRITEEYLSYPTAVDVKMEGQGTLKYPGISFCVTNWVNRRIFCERYKSACNFSDTRWREKILLILETEPNLIDVAVRPEDVIQFGFLNPTFYFVETYFRKESVQLSFSKLPKHMCFTMDWRKEQFMKFVHQNPLIFQAKLLFYWIPDEIIVMDPYEMDIGFHDVDSTSAGMKHAIVVEPSGEYIFSLEQILWQCLKVASFFLLLCVFLYQASRITEEYLSYPTAVDVKMEGQGTLKYPGISFCVTNWVNRRIFCERYKSACNFSDTRWREKILLILETEPNLIDVAVRPEDVIQFGFLNPTFYFVETYFRKESVQLSFSKLPKHMCFTMDWRKEQFMKFVHQNPLIFQAKLLFYWIPDEIIVMDPYEMDIGFHDVDSTSAGMKHAIVVEPSGEYIFSLEQKVVNYLPAPYDTKCTDYAKQRFRFHSTIYTKELCYEECRANVIQQSCGCLLQDYAFRHEMNDTACTHHQTATCVQESRRKMVETCNKKCGKGCKEYIYETKQSFWLTYNPEIEGEYYIRLKFLMTSRSVDVMQIIPLIQGTQILGIIGGYLGLWLGLSIYLILYTTARWILGSLRQKARSVLGRASIMCFLETVRTLAYSGCLVVCFYSVHLDYTSYQRFETTVVLQQSSMEGTKFPAVTVCNKEA
ncbi:uncharacterized protein ISCGN_008498 [Ixodes scapularis]